MGSYIYMKNKFYLLWVYNDFPYNLCKAQFIAIAFAFASCISYPFYQTRNMVDIWPKERGGNCTWNNSYRQCFKWMSENAELHYYNFFHGYTRWFKRYGAPYLIAIWMADSLGMMSNCNESYNSLESMFPFSAESV